MYFDNNGPTGPKCGDGRVHTAPANAEQLDDNQLRPRYSIWLTSAQWVDWWDVHLYRDRMLKRLDVPSFPMVGTVAWRDLADDHPAKLAAFDAATLGAPRRHMPTSESPGITGYRGGSRLVRHRTPDPRTSGVRQRALLGQAGDTMTEPGYEVLDALYAALTRYVAFPDEHATVATTLWIATTHTLPAFEFAPRLAVTSPEKRCGKSRLLDIIAGTCHKPLPSVDATVAAIFRSLGGDHPPTLIIDETDAIFGSEEGGRAKRGST